MKQRHRWLFVSGDADTENYQGSCFPGAVSILGRGRCWISYAGDRAATDYELRYLMAHSGRLEGGKKGAVQILEVFYVLNVVGTGIAHAGYVQSLFLWVL